MVEAFLQGRSELQASGSPIPAGSLLFAPPFQHFSEQEISGRRLTSEVTISNPTEPSSRGSDCNRPRKRVKTDDSYEPVSGKGTPVFVSENLIREKPQPAVVHGEPLTP